VEREFDITACKSFPKDELLSHAHAPVMERLMPDANIPVVLFFVNAIHVPQSRRIAVTDWGKRSDRSFEKTENLCE